MRVDDVHGGPRGRGEGMYPVQNHNWRLTHIFRQPKLARLKHAQSHPPFRLRRRLRRCRRLLWYILR